MSLWLLPEAPEQVRRWLEFLGPADRDRLRKALTLFPEQPVRRVSRRAHPEQVMREAASATLFDMDAYRPAG